MRNFPDIPKKKSRIEIIPMIDVMMFLLVFFVLISINVIPALGLKTKLPVSSSAKQENPPKRLMITLLKDGVIQSDGSTLNNLEDLSSFLNQKKSQYSNNFTVVINGDESASLQRLVDVMDVLKKNSIESMTIAAKSKS